MRCGRLTWTGADARARSTRAGRDGEPSVIDPEEEGRPEQPTSESGYLLAPASVVLALAGWFPLLNMAGMFLREQPVPWLAQGEPPVTIVTGVVAVALSAYLGTLYCLSVAAPRSVGPAAGAGILGTLLVRVILPSYGEPWWAASLAFLTGSLLASLPARLSHRRGPARGWPAFWWSAGCALAGSNWRVMAEGATERDWRRLWWLWGCFCLLVLGACAWIWTLAAAHAWEVTGHGPG
jgi:hypothetical protein